MSALRGLEISPTRTKIVKNAFISSPLKKLEAYSSFLREREGAKNVTFPGSCFLVQSYYAADTVKLPIHKWSRFKPSLCKTCFATCCHDMPLEASVPDLIRLGLISESEAMGDLKSVAVRLKRQKIIQTFHPKKMVFVIAQKKNKDCIFLDENRRCTVYLKRPEICRQFPKIGPKPGFCPYIPYRHEKS